MRLAALARGGAGAGCSCSRRCCCRGSPLAGSPRASDATARFDSVSVSAWPAIELLWGDADSVRRQRRARSRSARRSSATLLWEAHGVSSLHVSAEQRAAGAAAGPATPASRKRGSTLMRRQSRARPPSRRRCRRASTCALLRSGGGEVEVQASGGLFGVGASVDAVAERSEGKLVVHPLGFLIEGLRADAVRRPARLRRGRRRERRQRAAAQLRLSDDRATALSRRQAAACCSSAAAIACRSASRASAGPAWG